MGNMLVNTRDQKFLLYEQIGIEKLFETEKYADYNKETVDMMINEAEKLAVEVLLPTYDKGDKEGCKFEKGRVKVPACFHEAYKKFCEAGWLCCMRSVGVGRPGHAQQRRPGLLRALPGRQLPPHHVPGAHQRRGRSHRPLRHGGAEEEVHGQDVHRRVGGHHVPHRARRRERRRRPEDDGEKASRRDLQHPGHEDLHLQRRS